MKKMIFLLSCVFLAFPDLGFSRAPGQFGMSSVPRFRKSVLLGVTQAHKNCVDSSKFGDFLEKYPRNFLIAQPIVSMLAGVGAGVMGAITISALTSGLMNNDNYPFNIAGAFLGGFSGYVLGNAFTTWHYAKAKGVPGSFEGTLMGSLIGGFLGLAMAEHYKSFVPFFLGPPIFATISFHLTRK